MSKLRAQCKQAKKLREANEETEQDVTKAFRNRRHNASAQRKRESDRAARLKLMPDETITQLMTENMQELIKAKEKIDYYTSSTHKNSDKLLGVAQRRYNKIIGIIAALKASRK